MTAYHDPRRVQELLCASKPEQKTPNTIINLNQLFEEYQKIRLQGYAYSDEENTLGAFGISAPIFEMPGVVQSCLCIAGPKERFSPARIEQWTPLVIQAAQEVSSLLTGKVGETNTKSPPK